MSDFSLNEFKRFGHLRQIVKSWMDNRFEAGKALSEIRDGKLYRDEFETFEEFCISEYKIDDSYARRLMDFAEIKSAPMGAEIENERQARALSKVPEEDREEVIKKAKKNGKLTASSITDAAKETVKEIHLDKTKAQRPIPEHVVEDWNRSIETAAELVSMIQKVVNTLREGVESNDKIFREFTSSVVTQAEGLRYTIKSQLGGHALCPFCHGNKPDKCDSCSQRGFISKYFWDSPAVKPSLKAMLEKSK